ncbi:MAG: hypothetical protein OXJ62_13270 [Spirochaetaceae bacterium]|nr:hypothetical protein [Spirochaetaceae bacterium]MDE0362303.1 hypothetical protein [Rhodospirillaceae bacterium]
MKLLAILVAFAVLLGGCATAPAPTEPPPMWLVVALGVIALFVGFGLVRVAPAMQ